MPEPMDDWIKAQVASGRYGNDSEYVRELVRKDQDRQALAKMVDESERAAQTAKIQN